MSHNGHREVRINNARISHARKGALGETFLRLTPLTPTEANARRIRNKLRQQFVNDSGQVYVCGRDNRDRPIHLQLISSVIDATIDRSIQQEANGRYRTVESIAVTTNVVDEDNNPYRVTLFLGRDFGKYVPADGFACLV